MRVMVLFALTAALALPAYAADQAKPRDSGQKRGQHGNPPPAARPAPRHQTERQPEHRQQQQTPPRAQAERRHPQPRPNRYDAYRYRDDGPHSRGRRFFPRSYGFDSWSYGYRYHGMPFRPHWRYRAGIRWFYWPWYDSPMYGCGWYWLPTHREPDPVYDEDGEEQWVYDEWGWVYVCVD